MAKSAAPEQRLEKPIADSIPWLDGEKGYALGIEAGKLACRNPAGKKLASVPKELKESALAEQLTAMCEWLADHRTDSSCAASKCGCCVLCRCRATWCGPSGRIPIGLRCFAIWS